MNLSRWNSIKVVVPLGGWAWGTRDAEDMFTHLEVKWSLSYVGFHISLLIATPWNKIGKHGRIL